MFGTLLMTLLAAAPTAEAAFEPAEAHPGDAVFVVATGFGAAPAGTLAGRPLVWFPDRGGFRAVAGLPVETPLGPLELELGGQDPEGAPLTAKATLEVVDAGWPARELKVASKFLEPPPEVQSRIEEDRKAFADAFAQPLLPPLFRSDFGWPRNSRLTARFGDRRTFNGKTQGQHFGVDLDGKIGAPIRAANDGQVVLVRDAYTSGRTVVVHHGANLYSLYFHLSRIGVEHGAQVKKGQLLGRVGNSGRVTGPHLHWSMKVGDLYVDPLSVLRLPFTPKRTAPVQRVEGTGKTAP